jgi:hypothetical protein
MHLFLTCDNMMTTYDVLMRLNACAWHSFSSLCMSESHDHAGCESGLETVYEFCKMCTCYVVQLMLLGFNDLEKSCF